MRLEITSFKTHYQKVFDFDGSSITLISGESGIGKTTILEAIQWVLYGVGDDIHDKHGRSPQCKVTLYLSEISVFRQSRPNLLQVKMNSSSEQQFSISSQVYEERIAQSIIDQLYGDNLAWKATSYIEQRYLCDLVSGTNRDKLNLIGKFAFKTGDNPEEVITKLAQEIKSQDQKVTYNEGIVTAQQNEYNRRFSFRNIDYSQQLTEQSIIDNTNLLSVNTSELNNLTLKKDEQNIIKGKRQNLVNSIASKESLLLLNYREVSQEEQDKLDLQLADLMFQLKEIPTKIKNEINVKKLELEIKVVELTTLKSELDLFQTNLQNLKLNLQELTMKKQNFDKELTSEKSVLLPYQQTINILQTETSKLQSDIARFESNNIQIASQIPIVKDTLVKMKKELEDTKQQLETINTQYTDNIIKINTIIEKLTTNSNEFDKSWLQYNLNLESKVKYTALQVKYDHNNTILKEFSLNNVSEVNNLIIELNKKKQQTIQINSQIATYFQINSLQRIRNQYLCNVCNKLLTPIKSSDNSTENVCSNCSISFLQKQLDDSKLFLMQAHKSKDILQCPHCKNGVRYINNNLTSANDLPASEQSISELHQKVSQTETKIKSLNDILSQVQNIDTKIATLKTMLTIDVKTYIPEDQLTNEKFVLSIKDIEDKLTRLNMIHLQLEPLIPLVVLDDLIYITKLKVDNMKYNQQISSIKLDIINKTSSVNLVEQKLNDIEQNSSKNILDVEELKISLSEKEFVLSQKKADLQKLIDEVNMKTTSYSEMISSLNKQIIDIINEINVLEKEINLKNTTYSNLNTYIVNTTKQLNEQEILMITQHQNILNSQINNIKQNIQNLNVMKDNRINLLNEITNLKTELQSLILDDQIEGLYLQKKQYCDQLFHYIDYIKYHLEMKNLYDQIMKKQEELNEMRKDAENLRKLKKIAIDLECQQIEFAVKLINDRLATYLNEIFSDQISAKIMLYEQLKSKKRIVPKVNLKVTLKNVEYSKLKSLSWGEKDRISFALIMALSTINPSPVIMFDETFASLNKERIEICLTALKFAARSGKVVIITGHEQNGSYCDKIIKLE